MECNKMYLLLIEIIVFMPRTFSLWPLNNDLPRIDSLKRLCKGWIEFYGFRDDNYESMINVTVQRNFKLDMDIHWIVASYIYKLTVIFPSNTILSRPIGISPTEFCRNMDANDTMFSFVAVKDLKANFCADFIYLYGYSRHDVSYNYYVANSLSMRSSFEDYESIWASMYRKHIEEHVTLGRTPPEFCAELGKTEPGSLMPMIVYKDLNKVSCKDIIQYFDYTDDPQANHQKAKRGYRDEVIGFIPGWIKRYVSALLSRHESQAITIEDFCASWSDAESVFGQLSPLLEK